MSKKGNVRDGRSSHAEELNEEPESQDDQGGDADQLHKNEKKDQGKNPSPREEQQIGAQNAGDSPAGTHHGNR